MRIGIMQPYFFPFLGHFALIKHVDAWVVFDTAQFRPRSYMVRNAVPKPDGGTQRVGISVDRGSIHKSVGQTHLKALEKDKVSLLGSLSHYKSKAKNYEQVINLVTKCFNGVGTTNLAMFNYRSLRETAEFLGITIEWLFASNIDIDNARVQGPGDWAPLIAEALGATAYLNPIGGRHLFDAETFQNLGIELQFLEFSEQPYQPNGYSYIPNMSVLDPLMWLSADSISDMLDSASIERANTY